jgi:hypothetical protein
LWTARSGRVHRFQGDRVTQALELADQPLGIPVRGFLLALLKVVVAKLL